MPLALRYAARSDVGLLRDGNEDSGYAGPRLLAVADGMGGHAAGEVASSVAIATLSDLDGEAAPGDPLDRLAAAVRGANEHLRDMVAGGPELSGMGTTLTALLSDGTRFGVLHIGDSRGYLLRDGELQQITRDHTFVQTLIDDGRITEAEADHHPQRSLILRALDGRDEVEPDLSIREARLGDRYLICSDGLSGVVSEQTLRDTLAGADDPEQAVDQLVDLALRGGGPDNITVIVADVVDDTAAAGSPLTVGAAADGAVRRTVARSTAAHAAALAPHAADGGDGPSEDDEELEDTEASAARPRRGRWAVRLMLLMLLAAALGGGGYAAWAWSQQQYFVGSDNDHVAIFRGLPDDLGPVPTSRLYERHDIALKDLPAYQRERVEAEIAVADLADAHRVVATLRKQVELCREAGGATSPSASPTASPSASPGASTAPSAGPSPGSASPSGSTATPRPSSDGSPLPAADAPPRGCGDGS
ncbi:MAG: protein phosphatase 2C domain-containing protein [Chloroflexota bacterium]|nr:protein phosphatase 2C domain-containing protein [Chloroflexota bacterium]